MVFHEEHASHHDIGRGNVGPAPLNQHLIASVFRGGVQTQRQTWEFTGQGVLGPVDRAGQMRVHCHDHHLDGSGLILGYRPTERSKL